MVLMKKNSYLTFALWCLACCFSGSLMAQDDLLELLEEKEDQTTQYTSATFKGSRLINGHSVETPKKKVLEFLISHRFGAISNGGYDFFGLDNANVRLGLEYGLTDRLNIGLGRSSFEKTYDGFVKYKILRQSTGTANMPVSVVYFGSMAYKSLKAAPNETDPSLSQRMTYTHQLLMARKFSSSFSFQLMPTLVHRNAVISDADPHDQYALGMGGRIKLSQRVSLNAEYYHQFNTLSTVKTYNSMAVGFDIETGGHVFQLHVTNSLAMIEKGFITETLGDIGAGDLHFGFNISRVFSLGD